MPWWGWIAVGVVGLLTVLVVVEKRALGKVAVRQDGRWAQRHRPANAEAPQRADKAVSGAPAARVRSRTPRPVRVTQRSDAAPNAPEE